MPESAAAYPGELERIVTLRNGARVRVRPIRPDDEPGLHALYGRLSRDTAYQRFFTIMKRLPPDWTRFVANVDYRRRLGLVAEHRGESGSPELIAVARYEPTDEADTAEVAFVVEDGWQGLGLGTRLLHDLLDAAAARGIHRFRAWVLADNSRMLRLFSRFTTILARTHEEGMVELSFTRRVAPPGPPQG